MLAEVPMILTFYTLHSVLYAIGKSLKQFFFFYSFAKRNAFLNKYINWIDGSV